MAVSILGGSKGGILQASAPAGAAGAAVLDECAEGATVRLREAELPVDLEPLDSASFVSLEAQRRVRALVSRALRIPQVRRARVAAVQEALEKGDLDCIDACRGAAEGMLKGDTPEGALPSTLPSGWRRSGGPQSERP